MIVIDAHLDISWSALGWNRDLTLSVPAIRSAENGMPGKNRGTNTVSFPEMRKGEVAVALATMLARAGEIRDSKLDFRTQEAAYAIAQGQLAYYRIMEEGGHLRMLRDLSSLESHVQAWQRDGGNGVPLGFILSMEGADPIVSPSHAEAWWKDGLRVAGLVHYGKNAYAHGTGSPGGLTASGRELLKAMESVGMILDVTHLADESFRQAVNLFQGPILASHHNCRSLVPGDRQLTDDQIRYLIERDSVIGAALDDWMLYPGWIIGSTSNSVVTMERVVDHMDHICQLAGNARHIAIGSDLDGGFGAEQSPCDLDTIANLQKLPDLLRERGYAESEISGVMHGNWLRFFQTAWQTN
ncbi:MAG: dipeptidase [Terriglobia bacterium]